MVDRPLRTAALVISSSPPPPPPPPAPARGASCRAGGVAAAFRVAGARRGRGLSLVAPRSGPSGRPEPAGDVWEARVLLVGHRVGLRLRFDEKENVSNCIQLKTSVIKGIKNQLIDQFPVIEPWLNQIMPKKDPVKIVRCHEHIEILTVNGELLFFRQREGIFYPTLRLLHKYPFILPHQQVDKGAIKFVLSGANIMCPGLTSPGAKLYPAAVDTVVAIMAEGKQHALCVGVMKMSAEDIEKVNKGIGIENIHYLNDGLWHMKTYK
ncbi:malignant T-cell-amplified sequence 1 isoform X1 [Buteo buteo]|uniref:malignant T-cell-amplified sequence 1 isoform X1 n=1 Tax=Buteo buteo TaxID=30397 RepID=UPI003EBDE473